MNSHLTKIYIAMIENRAVVVETNLSSFIRELRSLDIGMSSLSYYDKRFKESNIIYHVTSIGRTYTLQKIVLK